MTDHDLARRCARLGFETPATPTDVQTASSGIAALIDSYGLPPRLWGVIREVAPVAVIDVDRHITIPEGARQVDRALLISTVRDRQLVIDLPSGEVLFFTPQRDYWMNASYEAFIRCVVVYLEAVNGLEPCNDLRAAVTAADPTALFDTGGIWAQVVHEWEVHQD